MLCDLIPSWVLLLFSWPPVDKHEDRGSSSEMSYEENKCNGNAEEKKVQEWFIAFTQSPVEELPEDLRLWIMFNNARKLTYFEKISFLFGRLMYVFICLRTRLIHISSCSPTVQKESVDFFFFYAGNVFRSPQRSLSVERDSQAPVPLSSPSPNRSCLCGQYKIDTLLENFL